MREDATPSPQIATLRPEMTAHLMQQTGLDGDILTALVHQFYAKIRKDAMLGPIFASRIKDWDPHLEQMVAFWHSVALMTGTYHGRPMPAHVTLPVNWTHFERWLELFRETAHETCPPAGAEHVIERAERIAQSLHFGVQDYARANEQVPVLR